MSKTRDALTHPVYHPRVWGRGAKGKPLPKPFWGLDTERNTEQYPGCPGCKQTGRHVEACEYGAFVCGWIANTTESQKFHSFRDLKPGTYWVWNLGYDIEGMVRDLGAEEGWAMREDGSRFKLLNAECVYFKGKRFEWKDDTGRRIFLEASSFYNRIGLKDAAKSLCRCPCDGCRRHKKEPDVYRHCGSDEVLCPMKDPVDASKMSLTKYKMSRAYREMVDVYCAKDARIAFRLISFLEVGFRDLGVDIGGTPGSTAKRFLANIAPFPRVIWDTHKWFLSTYCGGRFEITRRGVLHDARQYDIVSAYPWALAKCPMLTPTARHTFTRRMSDDAHYGAYEIAFKTDEYLGVLPGWKGNTRIYSKAEKRGWISRPELQYIQSLGHDYTIHRGIEIHDEGAILDGWEKLVMPLFNQKDGHLPHCGVWKRERCSPDCRKAKKGEPASLGAKVGVNSLYGILIQLIEKGGVWVPIELAKDPVDFAGVLALEKGPKAFDGGQFYAPCYSSALTSMVRVALLETTRKAGEENVVAFHTDSILLKDGATIPTGEGLGQWELAKSAKELVILKSGQYAMDEDVKGRGFSKRKLNPESEDEIAKRQKVDLWATQQMKRGRVSVRTAKDWRDVSAIRETPMANNIAWELKRLWHGGNTVRDILRRIERKEYVDSDALANVGVDAHAHDSGPCPPGCSGFLAHGVITTE